MGVLRIYDSEEIRIVFGTREFRGKAPDTFATLSREEDSFKTQVGSDGETTRSSTKNTLGKLVLNVQQASPFNSYLQSKVNADERDGSGIAPIRVSDGKGSYIAISPNAFVMKPADNAFGSESGTREWTIMLPDMKIIGGGNE